MTKMIRASFYKMFHDKASTLCLVGTALWTLLIIWFIIWFINWPTDHGLNLMDSELLVKFWRDVFSMQSVSVPLLTGMIVLFSAEFKDQSWKLVIAKGVSQAEYYFVKLLCCLWLEIKICFFVTMTATLVGWGSMNMPMNGVMLGTIFQYFVGQCIAHAPMTVLAYTVVFLIRTPEVASSFNILLLFFGSLLLRKLEGAFGLGNVLTGVWAFEQYQFVVFNGPIEWIYVGTIFGAYLMVCGLIVCVSSARRDLA